MWADLKTTGAFTGQATFPSDSWQFWTGSIAPTTEDGIPLSVVAACKDSALSWTMADATALLSSFSFRLRYHTGGLRLEACVMCAEEDPQRPKAWPACEVSVTEPVPLMKQRPPFTRTQTDMGSFLIQTFSPESLFDVTGSLLKSYFKFPWGVVAHDLH